MHKIYCFTLTFIFSFLLFLAWNLIETPFAKSCNQEAFKKLPKEERYQGRAEYELMMTQDMSTGDIPSERLFAAKAYTEKRLAAKEKNAIPNVNWVERGPNNIAGRTRVIHIDKADNTNNTVWAGGVNGGLWKSTNGGNTWTAINDFFDNIAISAMVQHPTNHSLMYFGTGEFFGGGVRGMGIWKTEDGGNNWTHLSSTGPGPNEPNISFTYVTQLAITNAGTLIATTASSQCDKGGIMRSTNGGMSWSRFAGTGVEFSCDNTKYADAGDIVVAANGDLYASMGLVWQDGIYKSTNDGVNWDRVYTSTDNQGRIDLATAPSDANRIYALFESFTQGVAPDLKKSINAGSTWTDMANPGWIEDQQNCTQVSSDWTRNQSAYDLAMDVDPTDEDILMIGGIDLFRSTNAGNSWTQISSWFGGCNFPKVHADQHIIKYVNSSTAWFGHDGGLDISTNVNTNSPSFTFKGNGYNVTQFYSGDLNPMSGSNNYTGGTQDNGGLKLDAPGIGMATEITGGDGAFSHVDQTNGNLQISAYVYIDFFVTLDNWATFEEARIPGSDGQFINPTDLDDNSKKLYCGYQENNYLRWEDLASAGTTLTPVTVSGIDKKVTSVRVSPNINNRVYFGLENGKLVRVDDAHTGTSKTGTVVFSESSLNGVISCIEIEPANENHILITSSNYGTTSVFESINANSASPTWTAVEGNLPDMPVRWAMFNPNNADQALLATELGVWSTTDLNGGNTDWDPTNAGLANTRVDMIKYRTSDKQVLAATHGRGLFTANDFGSGGGPQCSIASITAGTQSSCTASTNTYTQDVTITFTNSPESGMLDVNGQQFNFGANSQTVTLSDLTADGNPVNVTAKFTGDQNCTRTENALFTAPTACSNSNCQTYVSTDVPKVIPISGSISSVLTIADSKIISDIKVKNLKGNHDYFEDMNVTLKGPVNTSVVLFSAVTCQQEVTFDFNLDDSESASIPCPPVEGTSYKPSNLLSVFQGKNAMGTWTLEINDTVDGDGGNLTGWGLEICTSGTPPSCSISTIAVGSQSSCDPSSNTYTQDVVVTFANPPGTGMLDVNGQTFAMGESPQTVTLSNLTADGNAVNVTAKFTAAEACTRTENSLFTAPGNCSPSCAISALTAGTQSSCNPSMNTYSQDVTVTYSNPPGSGMLDVNGQTFAMGESPQTVTLSNLTADGNAVNVTAKFTAAEACTRTENTLFTAPDNCSPSCVISTITAGTQSSCTASTNTYTQEVTVAFTNPPESGMLDVNGQQFSFGANSQTVTLTNLTADGNVVNVTARFTADQSCTRTENALFTAPTSCSNSNSNCQTFSSTDVPKSISDSEASTLTSTLTIPNSLTIADIDVVSLTGAHTYIGDLTISLSSPSGTSVILVNESDCSEDDFSLGFDDSATGTPPCPPNGGVYEPVASLSAFNGQDAMGTWTLTLADPYDEDGGQLSNWGLKICTSGSISSDCDDYDVNGTIASGTYKSDKLISSSGSIVSGRNVMFKAQDGVQLIQNFTTQTNAIFSVNIENCNN